MTPTHQAGQSVSDTAFWIAHIRAEESARRDAVFQDPFAAELAAGSKAAPRGLASWPLVARTKVIDDMVLRSLAAGVDTVVNLAAGLDTRPYRLALPRTLRWIEADLAAVIDYKERALASAQPRCVLQRERVNLASDADRQALLERALAGSRSALLITEGLLMYLDSQVVEALGRDLAARPQVMHWVLDLVSPGVLRQMKRLTDHHLTSESRMRFAPPSGVAFFRQFGFEPEEVLSMQREAARLRRTPLWLTLSALLPLPKPDKLGRWPWAGIVRLRRT